MRAFAVYPKFELTDPENIRSKNTIDLITDIVFRSLRQGKDKFQHSIDWIDCNGVSTSVYNEDIDDPQIVALYDDDDLREWLKKSIDPFTGEGGTVRSAMNCRTAIFGYDGQAFLLLRDEDIPPSITNNELVEIKEYPFFINETDCFDG